MGDRYIYVSSHSIAVKRLTDLTISVVFIFASNLEDTAKFAHDLIVIQFVDLYIYRHRRGVSCRFHLVVYDLIQPRSGLESQQAKMR